MTLSEIIKAAIREAGGDGLCNVSLDCGCGVDDLAGLAAQLHLSNPPLDPQNRKLCAADDAAPVPPGS